MRAVVIDFEEAIIILADDANARSKPFLERVDKKTWKIGGLFGEEAKILSHETFLRLVEEHKIKGGEPNSGHFIPA